MDASAFNILARRIKRITVFSFLFLLSTSIDAALGVTLKDACLETLNHSKLLKSAKENVQSAESRVNAIAAERWPSLNLTSDIGVSRQRPNIEGDSNHNWNNSAGLELNWNLWDGGKRAAAESLEKLTLTKNEQQQILAANNAVRRTAEAYFGLHKALINKHNHEEKLKLILRQKSNIEEKVKNGLAAETGLMEIEGRIQQSEAIGIVLARKLKSAQSELTNAMGTDMISGIKVIDLQELNVTPLKTPQKVPWDNTIAGKIFFLDEQGDKLRVDQLDAKYGPQIDLTTNLSTGIRDVGVVDDHKQGYPNSRSSVNLTFKYNLFDAGQRRHERSAILSSQKAQQLERDEKRQEQRTAFEDLYQELNSFSAQSNSDRKLLEMEKKRFDIVEREYRRGAQSYLDLVTALDALSLAQQAVDDDLIAEQLGLIRLHNMAGSIYGAIIE